MKNPDFVVHRVNLIEHVHGTYKRLIESLPGEDADDDSLLRAAMSAIPKVDPELAVIALSAALALTISILTKEEPQADAARDVLRAFIAVVAFGETE